MTTTYDTKLRKSAVMAKDGASELQEASYSYGEASRLQTVSDETVSGFTATYSYLANSDLIDQVLFKQSTTNRMTTTLEYDRLNRLASIRSEPAAGMEWNFGYQYNDANQRTRVALPDGSYWVYQYDSLGQVQSGKRYWSDGTPVAGQQFEYAHDQIGNHSTTKVGGNSSGTGMRSSSYTKNRLNQYTARSVLSQVDILGIANPTASVTVKYVGGSTFTAYRKGEYFHYPLTVGNSVYREIEVKSNYSPTQTNTAPRHVFNPVSSEGYTHDTDGNLTQDGRWNYEWDAENRLVRLRTRVASRGRT